MPSFKRRAAVRDDSSEEPESSDNEEQGRVNDSLLAKVDRDYLNQPIDLKQGDTKLKQLVSQFNQLTKRMRDAVNLLHNVAAEFVESLAEEFRDQDFQEDKYIQYLRDNPSMQLLDQEFRIVLEKMKETSIRTAVISDIRQRIVQGHQITNLYETYQVRADKALEEYQSLSEREKFIKDKDYNDFVTLVWESFTDGASMPNIKKFLPRDASANGGGGAEGADDSDEELEIGAQSTDFRCPLTASILEDPYTSSVCPHSYSGEAIKEYIRTNSGQVACPVAGCSKKLTLATVERDDGLNRRVEGHLKRVKEGRTQSATQAGGAGGGGGADGAGAAGAGRTYVEMDDSDDE
ncbi:hypothetical protein JCM11491_002498 [Sporobolomyces phaffii]